MLDVLCNRLPIRRFIRSVISQYSLILLWISCQFWAGVYQPFLSQQKWWFYHTTITPKMNLYFIRSSEFKGVVFWSNLVQNSLKRFHIFHPTDENRHLNYMSNPVQDSLNTLRERFIRLVTSIERAHQWDSSLVLFPSRLHRFLSCDGVFYSELGSICLFSFLNAVAYPSCYWFETLTRCA